MERPRCAVFTRRHFIVLTIFLARFCTICIQRLSPAPPFLNAGFDVGFPPRERKPSASYLPSFVRFEEFLAC